MRVCIPSAHIETVFNSSLCATLYNPSTHINTFLFKKKGSRDLDPDPLPSQGRIQTSL